MYAQASIPAFAGMTVCATMTVYAKMRVHAVMTVHATMTAKLDQCNLGDSTFLLQTLPCHSYSSSR